MGPAVLRILGIEDSNIPPWVASTGIEVKASAGVRIPLGAPLFEANITPYTN